MIYNKDIVVDKNMNNTVKKRIDWIDIYKGILMICVLMGHIWSGKITTFMYVFHMSAFFFISGYLEKLEDKSLFELIQVKFKSLIIPYIGVNVLYSVMRIFFWGVGLNSRLFKESYQFDNFIQFIKTVLRNPSTNDIFVGSWFLLVLFLTSIVAKILYIMNNNKVNLILLLESFIIGRISYWLIYNQVKFIIPIDLALIALVFYIMGIYVSKHKFLYKVKIKNILVIILSACLYFYLFTINILKNVDYVARLFNGYFNQIFSATIGIIIVYNISKYIEVKSVSKLFKYIGKNSMSLMLVQFAIFRFITICENFIGIKENKCLMENSIVTQSRYDVFFYTILTIIIFYIFNEKMSNNKVYSVLFLGKYKSKIINTKCIKIFTYIILIFILIIGVPYKSIYHIKDYERNIDYCLDLKGRYEDKWVSEELTGTFKSGSKGVINIKLYSIEKNSGNSMKVYNGSKFIGEFTIKDGENEIILDVPKNEEIALKLEFKKCFIPSNIDKMNTDLRNLSVIINDITLK
ncbi:hypothetical protein DVV91_14840 [Clostridium botulinum]|uniref:acyltransferase family protein n=1 Tax=Clostridium botulinum TaxID=1491 RepID=UPI001966E3D4|nr:acyltransferase family protein [Clostridium botulinum]MBN1075618.1 hypothetical protein [Clostridium botulinum]